MCNATNHTVEDAQGQAVRVTINHSHYQAVQYDFYIPVSIWDATRTQTFLERLLSLQSGATVFNGLTGVWRGDQEETRIYRMILRADQFDRNNIRTAFQNEVGSLMADLSVTSLRQEAVLFTETAIALSLSQA